MVMHLCLRFVHAQVMLALCVRNVFTETAVNCNMFCSLNLTFLLPLAALNCVGSQISTSMHKVPILFMLVIVLCMLNLLFILQIVHQVPLDK